MNLPPLISLEEMPGEDTAEKWSVYIDHIYERFCVEVVRSDLRFRNLPIKCRFKPSYDGKHFAFWHLISDGAIEENRTPDFGRCERIAWIRVVIAHADQPGHVRCINQTRQTAGGPKQRVALWAFQHDYAVILEPRPTSCFLITTFCVLPHQRRVFEKAWAEQNP